MEQGKKDSGNRIKGMQVPVIAFAGWSGSGKTTLIEQLIPVLIQKGREKCSRPFRLAVIKHSTHGAKTVCSKNGSFADAEGTDTWRFRQAGADPVILCGPDGPDLQEALEMAENGLATDGSVRPDLILVEGFKNEGLPQIGVNRKANSKGWTADPGSFMAIVTDTSAETKAVPKFGFDDIEEIAAFILEYAAFAVKTGYMAYKVIN
ncbi:MAG: molybdopterin-guanine dinucleotide biosynthesis protein B [Lachnospiraceae bacterium]|nr:molybdopterin-guanine dinucleotide biosynthesis protein B [Lachnospiraceae bacterium]MBR2532430.1 molybdopterin-guanine dinucleotide biosynthesis protein B [Lachnospiraceae bacterium]